MSSTLTLQFYTRNTCPLCDKAKSVLLELQEEWEFVIEEFDIDESDDLTEHYGLMIPVVKMDGEMVEYGNVNKLSISKRLQEKTSTI